MNSAEMIGMVVTALGVLIGLYYTVCRPMLENQKTMTELTCAIREFNNKLVSLEANNTDAHRRIHGKIEKHDEILQDHENRIHDLETIRKEKV